MLLELCVDDSDEDCSTDEMGDDSAAVVKMSAWNFTIEKIRNVVGDRPALVYVRDIKQVVDVFNDQGIKATKYTDSH